MASNGSNANKWFMLISEAVPVGGDVAFDRARAEVARGTAVRWGAVSIEEDPAPDRDVGLVLVRVRGGRGPVEGSM